MCHIGVIYHKKIKSGPVKLILPEGGVVEGKKKTGRGEEEFSFTAMHRIDAHFKDGISRR